MTVKTEIPLSLAKGLPAIRSRALAARILQTKPVRTARTGTTELRVLVHGAAYLGALWTLKSFYYFSNSDLPLYIHDGGLEPEHVEVLREHFPDAEMVYAQDADERCVDMLLRQGKPNCARFRQKLLMSRKLFDRYLFSRAERVIYADSDILFFSNPVELVAPGSTMSYYNRDLGTAYSMPLQELNKLAGFEVADRVNAGLSTVRPESLDLDLVEHCLSDCRLDGSEDLQEQTLQAIVASKMGVRYLPETYLIAIGPARLGELACRHYPGFTRPLLYSEGMPWLVENGHLQRMS